MNTYALIVAAGKSVRFGGDVPKQFRQVCGRPLLSWTISRFEQASEIDKIVIVASEEHAPFVADRVVDEYGFMKVEKIVTGGETRQLSVAKGLQSLPSSTSLVAIHDGARPLVRPDDVDRVVAAARSDGCAMLAAPVTDTVKRGREGLVMATLDRSNLHLAQTPQAFLFDLIRRAHDE
ncbi:2-C-methyl-D-erythritol 4-phosphate cytidylyltransferase, partial [candidate division GN15 bacterium]|nr:2-C-methyl-D-erythritol 4-phosphate cytidylyltransferase [candidate division GN15 bacterium]